MPIKTNQGADLWSVISQDLKYGDYRTYTNGNIIVTVFVDEDIMKTTSTEFIVKQHIKYSKRPSTKLLEVEVTPLMSKKDASLLENFTLEGLQALAGKLGMPRNGSKHDIAFRIAGQLIEEYVSELNEG